MAAHVDSAPLGADPICGVEPSLPGSWLKVLLLEPVPQSMAIDDKNLLRLAGAALLFAFCAVAVGPAADPAGQLIQPGEAAATAPLLPLPPFADRAEGLLRQLSLEEKVSLMSTDCPDIKRSGEVLIPAFNWWQECLHGFNEQRERGATSFPQVGGGRHLSCTTACVMACTGWCSTCSAGTDHCCGHPAEALVAQAVA